jgi:ribose 5-phosphate isomerase B
MNISIGNDHAGVDLKNAIVLYLKQQGHNTKNHGTNNAEGVDYADFVHPVALDVENKNADLGIIICGSGNGAAMTANKHKKIRAALCWSPEITKLSRQHNNANILSIPARFVNIEQTIEMVAIFITTPFEGGRHQKRIEKIPFQ